ncbi:MAG: hypothetical protein SVV03_02555 [Candidatus Nanohaloarchaea archaeon]|nr:hypothetical protein [Candidatus Nanohaloarchaea archaeon]
MTKKENLENRVREELCVDTIKNEKVAELVESCCDGLRLLGYSGDDESRHVHFGIKGVANIERQSMEEAISELESATPDVIMPDYAILRRSYEPFRVVLTFSIYYRPERVKQ